MQADPKPIEPSRGPVLPFIGLDVLWIQVTGTLCNIQCEHCFISAGPHNRSHEVMSLDSIRSLLSQAREYGVKEYYFTGGEPFMHPEILTLVEETLAQGPLSILTNGLLINSSVAADLARLAAQSPYSFDLRVSVDGLNPEENDPIRGKGTFKRIMRGAQYLAEAGLNPVFTVTTVHDQYRGGAGRQAFIDALAEMGFSPVRVKFIPPFSLGREAERGGSEEADRATVLAEDELIEGEEHLLQCGSCRTVTSRGVYPCPILIEEQGARMGKDLDESMHAIRLNHPACVTCHVEGFSCAT
ncbi:MAG: radical SAM protein [Myxococcales bacterium]|nr:radical SAM protein [Myxococcales bacterium]